MRNIYIIVIQEIREKLLRMIQIEFTESYTAVKAIYRQNMKYRLQKRSGIPWQ